MTVTFDFSPTHDFFDHKGEVRSRPREQQITVAHRMQSAGAAKGAADLVTADGFADMVRIYNRTVVR
jgi:hypothetical protein